MKKRPEEIDELLEDTEVDPSGNGHSVSATDLVALEKSIDIYNKQRQQEIDSKPPDPSALLIKLDDVILPEEARIAPLARIPPKMVVHYADQIMAEHAIDPNRKHPLSKIRRHAAYVLSVGQDGEGRQDILDIAQLNVERANKVADIND